MGENITYQGSNFVDAGDKKKDSVPKVWAHYVQLQLSYTHSPFLRNNLLHPRSPLVDTLHMRTRSYTSSNKMSTKLYVGNLPEEAKEKDLRDLFQSFGDVSEVAILRGYGFVVSIWASLLQLHIYRFS